MSLTDSLYARRVCFQYYLFARYCYFRESAAVLRDASKSCNMFAHSFYRRLTFYSLLLLVLYFSFLLVPFSFFPYFSLFLFYLVLLSENIHGSKKSREEELLYAVKYFSGISHVDPFTASSISLELWYFRRKISSPSFPGIFSHLIRFHIVVLFKARTPRVSCAERKIARNGRFFENSLNCVRADKFIRKIELYVRIFYCNILKVSKYNYILQGKKQCSINNQQCWYFGWREINAKFIISSIQ